ncbi:hypothetical protein MLD38_034396 [Melastoma candidum]|uniref:Uncharacterized protein n=1 Tax=Melastoma candidum TaxID=119954 RepID=A0ACB9MBN0_9MYRT|nr:hypothetical protein MLD38_034396 [Melastoma candidum]
MVPLNWFPLASRNWRFSRRLRSGKSPERLFCSSWNRHRVESFLKDGGTVPVSWLLSRRSSCNEPREPSEAGIGPENEFLDRWRWRRLERLEMESGMGPAKEL